MRCARKLAPVAALLLSSSIAFSSPAPDRDAADDPRAGRIRAAIEEEVAAGFAGGVLVAVGDRPLIDDVFGASQGRPLARGSRFLIASAAKQFASAALAKLQDEGRLDLDDAISRHLDGVPPDKRAITIRQLLSHTSGLPQGYASEQAKSRQEAQRAIFAEPLTAAPGERFQYSNENYQLAVAIAEAVSGERYAGFLRKALFDPAGLRDTGQLAAGRAEDALAPLPAPLPARLRDLQWGGIGFYTTARDLFRWFRALRSGTLLAPRSVSDLFAPVTKIGEGHAALGWFIGAAATGERTIFTRGNDDIGASALLYDYPERQTTVVVLSHAGQKTQDLSWARAVHRRIEEILFPPPGG